jgi:hypothetical protein
MRWLKVLGLGCGGDGNARPCPERRRERRVFGRAWKRYLLDGTCACTINNRTSRNTAPMDVQQKGKTMDYNSRGEHRWPFLLWYGTDRGASLAPLHMENNACR